jgi:hypothetical protein
MPKVVLATDDPPARLPAWARGLDALAIVTLVLSIFLILFGGFVVHLPGLRVSVHSPARVLFIAAAAIAIRHAAVPALPLHVRILRRLRAARSDSPGVIASAALASRVAVLLVGYFAVLTIGFSPNQVGFEATGDPLLNLPARFDAGWYGGIALEGYHFQGRFDRQQNVAFFPAVPLLTRAGGHLVGAFAPGVPMGVRMARALWAGVVISMIAFVWAAVYLVRLARDSIGDIYAPAAVALLSAYPFAVFFSAPYTEGVFLLTAVGAFYHFRRRDWWIAATWGLLAGSTRPNGCLLSVALACLLLEDRRPDAREPRVVASALAAAAAPGIGMLAYSAYVHSLTGWWFGWARLHEAWGRSFHGLAPIWSGLDRVESLGLLRAVESVPFDTLNAAALVFALVMVWPVYRRVGLAAAVFVIINVVPPLLAGGVLSMGRITATIFPLFLALAAVLPRRAVVPLVTASAVTQGLVAALFFTWRPMF